MSESTIRSAIKNALDTVSNAGATHDYQRWSADWQAFLDLFKTTVGSTDQIRGWTIAGGPVEVDDAVEEFGGRYLRGYGYTIRGYLGVDDSAATEKTFAGLVEDVMDALDADATLHGSTYYDTSWARCDVQELRIFGDVLCHYAEVRVTTWEWQS